MSNQNFCIATLSETEKQKLYEVEQELKQKTGKEYVLIAWETK
nr:hypothetical protein [uncultured Cellulosilyticum sp.]